MNILAAVRYITVPRLTMTGVGAVSDQNQLKSQRHLVNLSWDATLNKHSNSNIRSDVRAECFLTGQNTKSCCSSNCCIITSLKDCRYKLIKRGLFTFLNTFIRQSRPPKKKIKRDIDESGKVYLK